MTDNKLDDFIHGYLVAVSTMLHLHDYPTIAEDLLREAGLTFSDAKRVGLDDFDMKILRPVFADTRRNDASSRKRRAMVAKAALEESGDA
jgi:hypothetical protein